MRALRILETSLVALVLFAGCRQPEETAPAGGEATTTPSAPATSETMGPARLDVAQKAPYGTYLTDSKGLALYMFEADTRGETSTCYDSCAEAWPPLITSQAPALAGTDVDASLLGTIERRDGKLQVTYNGWPLYYFKRDANPGDTAGQDVEGFGGEWYLVMPNGQPIEEEGESEG